jgi:uncharacterized damage-inducible protein DinB
MSESADILAELEFEIGSTEKLLEIVPPDKLEWQPHPKAMNLGALALHVATIPGTNSGFAVAGKTTVEALTDHPQPKNKEEILGAFRNSVIRAKENINKIAAGQGDRWDLTKDGAAVLVLPRSVMLRLLTLNHWYHHRGQLNTYLRILGINLPSVYGPSADVDPFA